MMKTSIEEKKSQIKNPVTTGKVKINHSHSTPRKYHIDNDCRYCKEEYDEWKITLAESWDIKPCQYCADGQTSQYSHETQKAQ